MAAVFSTFLSEGDSPNSKARIAALSAAHALSSEPSGFVTYRSSGKLLVVGMQAEIESVDSALSAHTDVHVTGCDVARITQQISLKGYLGCFEFRNGDAEPQVFDVVLDMTTPPLLQFEILPPGYYTTCDDRFDLKTILAELPAMIGEFDKPQYFNFNPSICAHSRSGVTGCTRCLDTCPTGAISSLGDAIEVNPNLCQGAGSCATACPSGAISYGYPKLADTLQRLRTLLQTYEESGGSGAVILFYDVEAGRDVVMTMAEELPDYVIPVEVEEVGSVGLDVWLSALAYGASSVTLLATPTTPVSVMSEVTHQLGIAESVLAAMGCPATMLQLCRSDKGEFVEMFSSKATTNNSEPARFMVQNDKRTIILMAIEHLYANADKQPVAVDLPEGSPFGEIYVDASQCTLCMACVSQCPAKALESGDESPQLRFIEANCVQCGLCSNTCPENAITLVPRFLYDLRERNTRRTLCEEEPFLCIQCSKPFATRQIIEKIISKVQDHPMFEGDAVERLKMCEDCRVKAMFASDGMGDKPVSPRELL
jgi:ferredoxin